MSSRNRRVVRRVLVAVEPGTDASCLDSADQIARAFGATLTAVQVLSREASAEEVLGASDALSAQVAQDTGRSPAAFDATVRCGDAVDTILSQAARAEVDLIVVGTQERQGLDRWRSVSTVVQRHAGCSVLVARSSSASRGPVLVAADLGAATQPLLVTAGAFAQQLNEPLVVLHAVEPNRHEVALNASAIFSGVVSPSPDGSTVEAYRAVADGALHAELAAAGVDGRPEVAIGDAATTVVARARELHASLVVVGTHDRGDIARFVLGSVAEKIVRDAPCSVLIVRTVAQSDASEQSVARQDARAALATEATDGAVGAAAGAAAGIIAGPVGMLAGGALGALAGVALGRKMELADHEAALHVRDLDAVDAEREFFAGDDKEPATRRHN